MAELPAESFDSIYKKGYEDGVKDRDQAWTTVLKYTFGDSLVESLKRALKEINK